MFSDVINFFKTSLQTEVSLSDNVACNFLGKFELPFRSNCEICALLEKRSGMGTKKWLREYLKTVNKKPVFLYERLTKQDGDLLNYASGLGMRTTSKNSKFINGKYSKSLIQSFKEFCSINIKRFSSHIDVEKLNEFFVNERKNLGPEFGTPSNTPLTFFNNTLFLIALLQKNWKKF